MTGSLELDQGLGTLLHFSALATRSRRALLLLCLSCFGLFGRWLLCDLGYFSFFRALSLLPPFSFLLKGICGGSMGWSKSGWLRYNGYHQSVTPKMGSK